LALLRTLGAGLAGNGVLAAAPDGISGALACSPLQPQPQPVSRGSPAGAVCPASAAAAPRTRSVLFKAALPWLDMAWRRARDASLPAAAGWLAALAGAVGAAAAAGDAEAAVMPALPWLDMA
jgi:hypothetical protein